MIALAATAAGVGARGYPSTNCEIRDLRSLRDDMARGRSLGFGGALCIHPAQVAVARDVFAPSPEERDLARRVLHAYDHKSGARA